MNADTLSAVKTFTVRELDRTPSAILDACDQEGGVKIRRRDGRTYTVKRDARPGRVLKAPDLVARAKRIFPRAIPDSQVEIVDRLLAGE